MSTLNFAKEQVLSLLKDFSGGRVSLYYKDLVSGYSYNYNPQTPMTAASVIKIPIMVELFNRFESGELSPDELYTLKSVDKMPSCGCLNMMHDGLQVTLLDLCSIMIILSDNSATNILIRRLGTANINATMEKLGLTLSRCNRQLWNRDPALVNLPNTICAEEMGILLERMYKGELISPAASKKMLAILNEQRLNSKIPMLLPRDMPIAHKTGEDDDISHDVGIVYALRPFILCVCGHPVDPIALDYLIARIAKLHFDEAGGLPE